MLDIIRPPDRVTVQTDEQLLELNARDAEWQAGDLLVVTAVDHASLKINLVSPTLPVKRVHLRWCADVPEGVRILGDHWERGYGDLEWRGILPERTLPWYALVHDGRFTRGCGVKTGSASLCSWRVDQAGVSLWLDLRSGGVGVELGDRRLHAATVVTANGGDDASPFEIARRLCQHMCDGPRMPAMPVYGGNNWYYAYGNSSHEQILKDSELIASLAPDGDNRPFMVIDDGWQVCHGHGFNGGPWDAGNAKFPDMPRLARRMRDAGVRPGIWMRPLWTKRDVPSSWLFPEKRMNNPHLPRGLDPSLPEVLKLVTDDIHRLSEWGFELVKHDFTTFDICGLWGMQMGREVTPDGWHFVDRSRTTAEIILDLYHTIRESAGRTLVLGCNTIGHLAAGLVEIQRTGDDTSGIEWERTRQRGVNTLAFRACQHGTLFAADADCVGLTNKVPWDMNRQWLDLVARSGTPLFVSASPDAVGPDQRGALREAFTLAAHEQPVAEPIDWLNTTCPAKYRLGNEIVTYDWLGETGCAFSYQ